MSGRKNKRIEQDAEYGIDSRYHSKNERASDAESLMEARLKKMRGLSGEDIIYARLLQLKLKMEDYLSNPVLINQKHFSECLKLYIDSIYSKRSSFAADIDITPVYLSQIINNHREPKEEFLMKLMVHSEIMFKNVYEFQPQIWYQIYYQDKLFETLSTQGSWRPKIEEHITISEPFEKYNKA